MKKNLVEIKKYTLITYEKTIVKKYDCFLRFFAYNIFNKNGKETLICVKQEY